MVNIGNDWDNVLKGEFDKEYYLKLRRFLKSEYKNHTVYPDMYDIFNRLKYTPYADVKVVILGQDPYGPGSRAFFFGAKRRGLAAVPCEYLQGNIRRIRRPDAERLRLSHRLGKAGGTAFERNADGQGAPGEFPFKTGLADFHRQCD